MQGRTQPDPVNELNLLGRISENMQETKVEVRSETQPVNVRVAEPRFKSSFDNAEYQRWCEKLRNRFQSK
jgi:hypothetical protein